ncbi:MazF family transcriptional regulator [Frankia sp. CcI156]|uniref:Transcriptional modulator of MazE/toxin, MazF n=1 Tax=Frankia casuarinae (strain DSM 45818 / CECT 9043 / HFP020203 / CcI3) TaxID=106370 RepID=Q2J8S6_FRACC|nr:MULTISPECIES: MazF family transcriptional regulator [Frankia]ABD12316.1 transcriptional modulator of MazE/toxin, MazF [Frankia casuarinae]ETA01099.1 growth inhibitor [Frankia sp. CcI6]EYT90927.1 growth inhibitor [Frankia casuarinae]KDA42187.1 growth inhibitor [Frankia sp. BMG5.23]KEZ35696.1 growth inhibitor [Frankia sp. CeD]
MRPPRRGEIWTAGIGPAPQAVLILSSTVYNEIADEPTVLVALVVEHATDEGFCVDLGEGQWAVMGLVTFVAKAALGECLRRVDAQTLTTANTMLFKILATPER